jgi:hypothetical protein
MNMARVAAEWSKRKKYNELFWEMVLNKMDYKSQKRKIYMKT